MNSESIISRRALVATAGLIGTATLSGAVVITPAVATADETHPVQYGFSMNLSRCVNCGECVKACRYYNKLADDTPDRRRIISQVVNKQETVYVSSSCMHCAEPSCAQVCPARAIVKGEAGIVKVDKDRCIGCKYCFQACPFEVPHYISTGMDKCDCCTDAGVVPGETPYCVRACIFNALEWGPLEQLIECAGSRAQFVPASTGPSCVLVEG